MQADATNVFLNSVKECAPTILEKNSFPLLEFKKPVYNEELTDEIAKLLRNPLTPIFATRPTPKAGENLHNHQAGDNLHNHQSTTNSITRKPANRSYILISPIPGREDHKPAAVKWSLPELNIKLSADSVTEEDTVNVQQQNPELDSQEEDFDSIFVDIVGSIPEYYKHEIAPTHEKIQQLKEAVDYWIEKADTRRDMMQTAIESCIKKNSFIQQIWTEKEELEQQIEILKKQLEQEKKEGAKLQGELHALKSNRRQLQEQHELLEGEKLSCIESMKEKDTVIASLQQVMGKKIKQGEQGEIPMKEQADKEKKDERIAEESELEMQESPNDEDENADGKTPEKLVIMQAKEVGTRPLRSGIKIIKDRKDRKPAKKPDYTYPEAHKKGRKRASQSEDEAANKKKEDKDTYLQLHMYEVYNRLDEISKKKLENYWKSASDSEEDAFYLQNRTILYKHNIEKLMGDGPISALIIDAYGEALNDDAKQNPQKQKNAYLSANNYMFLRGASHKLTYHAFYMPLLENIGRVDRVFIPITDENHHTLLVFDTGAAKWTHFNSFRGTSEQTLQYYHKKAIVLVETANIFLCLLKECAAVSLKTKLVQIPDFDAKKPRGLNEASARMITKILASNELTPEYAQTMKYLICHDTTNFKLTENRECPQQANNSNDCGVFVMHFMKQLSKDQQIESDFNKEKVWQMRKEVLMKIMSNERSWISIKEREERNAK